MRVVIEIELEDIDNPTYTERVNDALLQYVAASLRSGSPGRTVFEREWVAFYEVFAKTKTTLTVNVVRPPEETPNAG